MKHVMLLTVLLPMSVFAQPVNVINSPPLPDNQTSFQQRMLNEMEAQQIQQNLQAQIKNNTLRIQQGEPRSPTPPPASNLDTGVQDKASGAIAPIVP